MAKIQVFLQEKITEPYCNDGVSLNLAPQNFRTNRYSRQRSERYMSLTAEKISIEKIEKITSPDGKRVLVVHYGPDSIERIRRITGYFCKLHNCNAAKLDEIADRVPHCAIDEIDKI